MLCVIKKSDTCMVKIFSNISEINVLGMVHIPFPLENNDSLLKNNCF